jgi:acyl-CoA synthetase (AMP-forming)/AMP-acid ligase II
MMGQALYGYRRRHGLSLARAALPCRAAGLVDGVQALGGTVILMERFDAEKALEYIEKYKVTCAQWVPTHFVRMLKLPPRSAPATTSRR